MKILISNDGFGAHLYIRMGLARAFTVCGHECVLWDINRKPVNDAFDEFEPDIFLGQTYNTNRVVAQAIYERPHLKVIMKGSEWGELNPEEFPTLKVNNREKRTILDLYESCRKPDYIHIYYHPDWIEKTHGEWRKNGIPIHSHMNAADIIQYTNGKVKKEFKSDVSFIGGYWPYKAQTFDKYLLPICKEKRVRVKIFGGGDWPTNSHYGSISDELTKDVFRSALICPNLHEPHSQKYGYDLNERTFKLLSNKSFVISDYVEGLDKLFKNNEIILAKTPEEFREHIYHYTKYPDERLGYIHRGYKEVIENHTYFNRVIDIFNNLGFEQQAEIAKSKFKETIERLKL